MSRHLVNEHYSKSLLLCVAKTLRALKDNSSIEDICFGLDSIGLLIDKSKRIDSTVLEDVFNICQDIVGPHDNSVTWRKLDLLMQLAYHPDTPKHVIVELVNHRSRLISYPAKRHPSIANYITFG